MEKINDYFIDLSMNFNKNYFDFLALISKNKNYTEKEIQLILKAYKTAMNLHANQRRKSGEKYITHPLNVAYVLAKEGFDYETICAALLHDTVEDTNYTFDKMKDDFNETISILVDGVTKMKGSDFLSKKDEKIATHEKILECITKDARIIAIKLVDRLHNMYTLQALSPAKQIEIAKETYDFYVNLARILGIYQVKDELQDLSLFYLYRDEFLKCMEIRNKVKRGYVDECRTLGDKVKENLKEEHVLMEYNYKVKNIGGIYGELKNGLKLNEIHDLVAIRMLVNNKKECYEVLRELKNTCNIVDGSIVDLIKNPKYNGYQSLNANIKTNKDFNVQTRIRTHEMQTFNELGFVSNWSKDSQKILTKKCTKLFKDNSKEVENKKEIFKI